MKNVLSVLLIMFLALFLGCAPSIKEQISQGSLRELPDKLDFQAAHSPAIDYSVSLESEEAVKQLQAKQWAKEPKVTATFENQRLDEVLSIIATDLNINIIVSDNVQGFVSCALADTPLPKALDMLCFTGGFTWKRVDTPDDKPYYIVGSVTPGDYSNTKLLVTEKIKTNRPALKVYDLLGQSFQPYVSVVSAGKMKSYSNNNNYTNYSLLASQQSQETQIDVESYELTITGPKEIVGQIKKEIQTKIDPPLKQIAIQVVFAEDRSNNDKKVGVNWANGIDINALSSVEKVRQLEIGSGVILGWQNSIMGELLSNVQLMTKKGKIRIKDAPQIMTREGYPATLRFEGQRWFKVDEPRVIGQDNYYFQKQTEPYKYGTVMQVLPSIADNGDIVLRLSVKMDQVLAINNNGFPIIDSRYIESETQLASGATLVLGGHENKLLAFEGAGVPGLSKLPIVKAPFSMQESKDDKVKLIVFVTAWLLEPAGSQKPMVEVITKEIEKKVEVEVEKIVPSPYVDPKDWQNAVERGTEQNGLGEDK